MARSNNPFKLTYIRSKVFLASWGPVFLPQTFRRGKSPVTPTPGGRWKVRQINYPKGCFRVYKEHRPRVKAYGNYERTFYSFHHAIAYAQGISYFFHQTRHLNDDRLSWLSSSLKASLNNAKNDDWIILVVSREAIDDMIQEESEKYRQSLKY